MRVKGRTFYCKHSGLEVQVVEKASHRGGRTGAVRLRFFPLEPGGRLKQVVLMLEPEEAVKLAASLVAAKMDREGSTRVIYHQLEGKASWISLDVFVKDGQRRIGLTAARQAGQETTRVSFAFSQETLELFVLLLKHLAVEACFQETAPAKTGGVYSAGL